MWIYFLNVDYTLLGTYTTASLVASKVAPTLVAACLPYASLASKALLLSSPIVVPVELQGEFLTSILINAKNQRQKPYTMASFEAFAAASLALKSLPGNAAILSALALECHEQKQNYMSHYWVMRINLQLTQEHPWMRLGCPWHRQPPVQQLQAWH